MKLQKIIIFLLLISLNFSKLSYAEENKTLPSGISYSEIGNKIEAYVSKNKNTTAAMEVAVFDLNGIIYKNCFGYSNIENGNIANNETVLEWGSVSKLLVWISVMQLWEQGKIDLTADIRTYLPKNFLTNLNYNKSITMTNLMNHDAGFQEMVSDLFLKDYKHVLNLKEALQLHPPKQIYEPGTVSAYSNWGTALAAYIIEYITQKPYYEYVKKNIFEPLGMEHTAISVDLSDNNWVKNQRKSLQCYTSDNTLIPQCYYYIPLYPAGICTGTLDDFVTLAKALIPINGVSSPLFKKSNTLNVLLSPTAYYTNTNIASNCHGLWTTIYSVPVLGHGGNTVGCSSNLQIDTNSGIGIVVMTNQKNESTYNHDMMKLIFGDFKDSTYANYNRSIPKGFFRTARTIKEGPFSLYSATFFTMNQNDLKSFWTYDIDNGIEKIIFPYGDAISISIMECVVIIGLLSFFILGTIYSFITLFIGGFILSPIKRRKLQKQGIPNVTYTFRKWNYIACTMQLLLFFNLILLILQGYKYAPSTHYIWQFILCGILGLAMAIYIVFLIIKWSKLICIKKEKVKYITTALFMGVSIINIIYWNLYAFWAI